MASGKPILRMRWRHLLFMHWAVDAEAVRGLVPPSLEVDTFEGKAWVGLIPFTMEDVLPTFVPSVPPLDRIPAISAFHECNVRTYVYPRGRADLAGGGRGRGGVWFFSLDAASRAAVWAARRFWRLPYYFARMRLQRTGDEIDYRVQRGAGARRSTAQQPTDGILRMASSSDPPSMRCRWRAVGEVMPPAQPGELAHFLTERYCLYTVKREGPGSGVIRKPGRLGLYCCPIDHRPWPLRRAELLDLRDGLVRAAGIEAIDQSQAPVLHHADELDVRAFSLQRVDQREPIVTVA